MWPDAHSKSNMQMADLQTTDAIVRIHMCVGRETAADRPASDERRRRTVGKRYWYGWNTGGVRRETDEMSRPTVPHRMGNVRKRPGNVRNTDVLRWETEELRMDCQGGWRK